MINSLKRICVFCGSNFGKNPQYKEQAKALGQFMAASKIELVYGGGNVGLMGEIARSVLENGGRVIGVIPKKLYDQVEHVELSELYVVDNMHERKAQMYDLADSFIALPGGIGTIEELSEVFAWCQLGYHCKPIGMLDVDNFFQKFASFLDHLVEEGFLRKEHRKILIREDEPESLIKKMVEHQGVSITRLKSNILSK